MTEKNENVENAEKYFEQALENFIKIDHFRGIYISLKDIYDIHE